ncbi:LacI family DNA-binding transcriptional regulator [Streptacidiphilus sp. N1-12]|uniref:LacI family DNA-binding transcriptional regulator n=2 Tax=Streptacidiphilus alkalitolerans TaxID=3342712 RepID=A0ABV6W6G7_9ACTN
MPAEADGRRTPLYQQVKRELLAAIASGEYSPGVPFVTQREICERFGVSHATAVRALNDLAAEGQVVRRRGRGTFVAEPDGPTARAGRDRHDRRVACVLQTPGPHTSAVLAGAEAVCAEFGYRLYLRYCEGDPEREAAALRDALADRVSGILVYPAQGQGDPAGYTEVARSGTPLVMVDRYRPELACDAVVADNVAAGRELTEALITAGHTVMATLWDETGATSVRDRLAGHVQALREHGLPVRPDLTVLRRYHDLPDQQRRERLAELLDGARPPTVLLCANGFVLATAAEDLLALGREVPGDLDLAGMDDAGPFDILPLTAASVAQPSAELGRTAMRLLHRRIAAAEPHPEPELVVLPVRVSTRRAAPGHLRLVGATADPIDPPLRGTG